MTQDASGSGNAEKEIYNHDDIIVTPTWLSIDSTSYAIRYIRKITRRSWEPPRSTAMVIGFFALVFTVWQLIQLFRTENAFVFHWILLICCVLLLLSCLYVAMLLKAQYRLEIVIVNEHNPLFIHRASETELNELYKELLKTMDYHRGGEFSNATVSIDAND
jgi:hypothetical protein